MFHARVLPRLSITVKKQENQKRLGVEERVYVACFSVSHSVIKGSQSRNLEACPDAEVVKGAAG